MQQASALTREIVEATLAEAMAHAEQCLQLISNAEETPGRFIKHLRPDQSWSSSRQGAPTLNVTASDDTSMGVEPDLQINWRYPEQLTSAH